MAYDDQKTKDPQNLGDEHMRRITGIDQDEEGAMEREARKGAARDTSKKSLSGEDLKEAEAGGPGKGKKKPEAKEASSLGKHDKQIGGGYKGNDNSRFSMVKQAIAGASGRKKALAGGGILGLLITLMIILFIGLLPLKINSLVENLQSRFYGTAKSAVSRRSEKLFSEYMKRHVLPGLNLSTCQNSRNISRDCVPAAEARTPAAKLFNTWRDARIENKLADNYGIEFSKTPTGFTLKAPGVPDTVIGNDFIAPGNNTQLKDLGTAEFRGKLRGAINDGIQGETRLKKVMFRFKVGRYVERKYGVRRCIFACKTRDDFSDWGDKKTKAARMMIVERVVQPHTESLGFILGCILSDSCTDDGYKTDENSDPDDTQRRDAMEQKIKKYLEQRGVTYGEKTVAQLADSTLTIIDGNFTEYLIKQLAGETAAKVASKAIPIIGWIDTAATIVNTVANAGPKMKRYAFMVNAAAMASLYMMYRTHADEIKSGHADAALVGSMVSTLSDTAGDTGHTGQPAEISPLYSKYLGSSTGTTTSSLIDTLLPNAFAADISTQDSPKYTCDNGKQLGAGKLVCPEESLVTSNFLTAISELFADGGPLAPIKAAAEGWKFLKGPVDAALRLGGDLAMQTLSHIVPFWNDIQAQVGEIITSMMQVIAKWLIPSPISDKMSGARTFQMITGGADVSGNDYAHYGLGAKRVSDQTAARIQNEELDNDLKQFRQQPFFARMFSNDSQYSFVSRLAMSVPTSSVGFTQSSFGSLLTNPLSKLMKGFGALFSSPHIMAATAGADPFGIPQYAYDPTDQQSNNALNINPDILTDEYCAEFNKVWSENDVTFDPGTGNITSKTPLTTDPDTNIDVHKSVNPCLLEKSTVGSAGGYYSDEVLTEADLGL